MQNKILWMEFLCYIVEDIKLIPTPSLFLQNEIVCPTKFWEILGTSFEQMGLVWTRLRWKWFDEVESYEEATDILGKLSWLMNFKWRVG